MSEKNIKENLNSLFARGVLWSGISQYSRQILQLIVTVVLARLLTPEDFGVVSMANIFTTVITSVNEYGWSAAIIQRKEIKESHLCSAFWSNIAFGIASFVLGVAISPLVANFFRNALVAPVLIVSSTVFIIGPFGVVHRALLAKKLDIKWLSVSEIGATVASSIVAIVLAFIGFGVWSLVSRMVCMSIITVVILWLINDWRPSAHFDIKSFKELFSFGSRVMGSNIIKKVYENVDYLVIGRVLGASALGFYTIAYNLTMYSIRNIHVADRVTFPAFSAIQDDNERLRRVYLKFTSYVSLIGIPAFVGLLMVAPEFIKVVYGEKWAPAILPFQILCIIGIAKSVSIAVGSILRGKGRADIEFKLDIFKLTLITAAVIIGSRYGIIGVASAIALVAVIELFITQAFANSLINLRMFKYISSLYPALFGSGVMLIVLVLYRKILTMTGYQNDTVILISMAMLGMVIYFGSLKLAKVKALDSLIQVMRQLLNSRTRSGAFVHKGK